MHEWSKRARQKCERAAEHLMLSQVRTKQKLCAQEKKRVTQLKRRSRRKVACCRSVKPKRFQSKTQMETWEFTRPIINQMMISMSGRWRPLRSMTFGVCKNWSKRKTIWRKTRRGFKIWRSGRTRKKDNERLRSIASCYSWKTRCSNPSWLSNRALGSSDDSKACRIGMLRQKQNSSCGRQCPGRQKDWGVGRSDQKGRYKNELDVKTANDEEENNAVGARRIRAATNTKTQWNGNRMET